MSKAQWTDSSYLLHCPQPSKMVPFVATWEPHIQLCILTFLPSANEVWCKVMFLLVPVILFTGRGGGVGFPVCITGHMPSIQGGSAYRGSAYRESGYRRVCLQGSVSRGSAYRGSASRRSVYRGSAYRGSVSRGVCQQGVLHRGDWADPQP